MRGGHRRRLAGGAKQVKEVKGVEGQAVQEAKRAKGVKGVKVLGTQGLCGDWRSRRTCLPQAHPPPFPQASQSLLHLMRSHDSLVESRLN